MKKLLSALGLTALVAVVTPANAQDQWNLATPYPEKVFHDLNIKQFVKEIEEGTNGRLKITTHHGASLFKHPEIRVAVKTGQIEMAEIQLDNFANEDEFYNFDAIPFMATTYQETAILWEAARPFMEKRFKRDGIRMLYWVPWPSVGFYSKKRIETLADLKGLKMRTFNRLGSDLAKLLGAQPVVVVAAEVAQAFSTNLIDSMITSTAFGASVQAWDFVKYFLDARVWHGTNQIVVNEGVFQRLSPEMRKVILDAAARAEKRGLEMSIEASETQKKLLIEKGMIVTIPSDEFMGQARALARNMIDDWVKATGDEGRQFVAKYEQLRRSRKPGQ